MNRLRFHFSMAGLLGLVALTTIGCAALATATPLVASALHTLNLLVLSLAVVGAIARRGEARVFWLGMAVVGWVYYFAAVGWPAAPEMPPQPWTGPYYNTDPAKDYRPQLLTSKLLDYLETLRTARLPIGAHVVAMWQGGGYWPGKITDANETGYLVAWDDGSVPSWDTPAQIASYTTPFHQVGHAVFGLLLALLAGWLMACLFGDNQELNHRSKLLSGS